MHSKSGELKGTVGRVVVSAQVGAFVELDSGRGENLLPCDDWDAADFRFPDPVFGEKRALAINVHVTGRTVQKDSKIRVAIEWVGDGEPSVFSKGWMYLERAKKEYPA